MYIYIYIYTVSPPPIIVVSFYRLLLYHHHNDLYMYGKETGCAREPDIFFPDYHNLLGMIY